MQQKPQDQRDQKRQCLLSPVPTIGDLEVRGQLRSRYGISSICGNAAWLFGQNGTSMLNCHLTMSKRTLTAGHVHCTDTMSTQSMAISGSLTAGHISTSASVIAESIVSNSMLVSQSLVVAGSIKQQNGGELLLGADVTHLNTNLVLPRDRSLTTGAAVVTSGLEVGSGLIQRSQEGASITLAACTGGTTVITSNLSIPNRTVTAGTVTLSHGRIGRPTGAQFTLGAGASCSTLNSNLELINGDLKAKNVFATGVFSHSGLKLGHIDVCAIDGAIATVSAFNYLSFRKDYIGPTKFGMDAQEVHKCLPFLVSEHHGSIDYVSMIPLLGAAVKAQHQTRLRVGKVTLCRGVCVVNVADMFGVEFGHLLQMHGAIVLTQNVTGWGAVRGCVHGATILIESVDPASTDCVGYCVVLID